MKTRDEYIQLLKRNKDDLMRKYHISRLGIFGSVARGEQTANSDVDICFESAPIGLFAQCRLKAELEQILGCRVDLLRIRKQLEGTVLQKALDEELIYV